MPITSCPVCDGSFETEYSTSMPFCSARCKQIDLGRWIDEGYGLQIESRDDVPGWSEDADDGR
jgi:endogenous inhibitor of DNA gyrase (YacG/DUF329 family)